MQYHLALFLGWGWLDALFVWIPDFDLAHKYIRSLVNVSLGIFPIKTSLSSCMAVVHIIFRCGILITA